MEMQYCSSFDQLAHKGIDSDEPPVFDTVYFGGGTPSLLDISEFELILSALQKNFRISADSEITVEVNPADRDISWFKAMRAMGINRLNIGVQSFDDPILEFLGRRHNGASARIAIEMALGAGFDNIGLDLIYNIPGNSLRSWKETMRTALSFKPAHLSCYELSIEENTSLAQKYRKGEFSLPNEDQQWTFFSTTSDFLVNAGYFHYEVSNFASNESLKSRHNQKYWLHTPYLGLGPAAHSFSHSKRWWNIESVQEYIQCLDSGHSPIANFECLTREQLCLESLFLGLRMSRGVDINQLRQLYDYDLLKMRPDILKYAISEGYLVHDHNFLRTTCKGLAIADHLALLLYREDKTVEA